PVPDTAAGGNSPAVSPSTHPPGPNHCQPWRARHAMFDRIAVGGLVACVGVVALCGLANAVAGGEVLEVDRYTPANSLDAYSQAGVIRAAERFASDGFAVTYGLPDVAYGPRFPRLGLTGPSGPLAGETVYHGDPPGTYWIAGALFRPSGDGVLRRMRMAPI